MKYEFTADYKTGIELIDREHARLFEIANETYELLNNELLTDKYDRIVDLLAELKEYTRTHFAHEEEFMEQINFQHIWSEKHAHINFINKLEAVDLNKVDESQQAYIEEVLDFLILWLQSHIKFADKRIGVAAQASSNK